MTDEPDFSSLAAQKGTSVVVHPDRVELTFSKKDGPLLTAINLVFLGVFLACVVGVIPWFAVNVFVGITGAPSEWMAGVAPGLIAIFLGSIAGMSAAGVASRPARVQLTRSAVQVDRTSGCQSEGSNGARDLTGRDACAGRPPRIRPAGRHRTSTPQYPARDRAPLIWKRW